MAVTHLVFGSEGFLGKHLMSYLARAYPSDRVEGTSKVAVDLRDEGTVSRVLDAVDPDRIYHLAGMSRVSPSIPMPEYFESNFLTTAMIARALKRRPKATKICFASTAQIYGAAAGEVEENVAAAPQSDYAFTKYLAEECLRKLSLETSHSVVAARLYSCFGPGQEEGFVVPDLCKAIASLPSTKGRLKTGPLAARRRFTDARDAVAILVALMQYEEKERFVAVNVASPYELTIEELAQRLLRVAGKTATLESTEKGTNNYAGINVATERLKKRVPAAHFRAFDESLRDAWAPWKK